MTITKIQTQNIADFGKTHTDREINISHRFKEKQDNIKIMKMGKRFFKNHQKAFKKMNQMINLEIKELPRIQQKDKEIKHMKDS